METPLFISYNKADLNRAREIEQVLRQAGYGTTLQDYDATPGQQVVTFIDEALLSATRVIAVLSPDYLTSHWAMTECNAALGRGSLVPVLVRECAELPPLVGSITYIDLTDVGAAEANERLLEGLERSLQTTQPSPRTPNGREQRPATRLRVVLASAVAAMIILCAAVIAIWVSLAPPPMPASPALAAVPPQTQELPSLVPDWADGCQGTTQRVDCIRTPVEGYAPVVTYVRHQSDHSGLEREIQAAVNEHGHDPGEQCAGVASGTFTLDDRHRGDVYCLVRDKGIGEVWWTDAQSEIAGHLVLSPVSGQGTPTTQLLNQVWQEQAQIR